jgi:hypothetical protein
MNDESPEFIALRKLCSQHHLVLYICGRDQRAGRPHIHLKRSGLTLAYFHTSGDAAEWLQPSTQT